MKLQKHSFRGIFFLLTLITTSVQAQKTYSLQACTEIALKQSLQLRSDTIDLEKTNASVKQAYSALLPSININAAYQYSPQVQASILPSETFGGPAGSYAAARLGVAQTKSANAELTQALFNPSALIGLKAAKVMVAGNQLQLRSSSEDLVYNVAATYYNIQSLIEQERLTQLSLNNTEALLQNTTGQLQAGLATETDVERLTVNRDNTKANLETIQNNTEKYFNLLKVLMNLPLSDKFSIEAFAEQDYVALPVTAFNASDKTNYQQVLQSKKVAELQYQNIKAGLLPTLSFYASYGEYGYYKNANPFKNLTNQFYPSSNIGVKLKIPIFDGFNVKYQAVQKRKEIEKLDVQATQTLQQNEKEVADAMADIRSNGITYGNQKRNLALAQKVMKDIDQQYRSGLVKMSDVINANNDLQTAQNNYISSLINLKQAALNLRKAQGILLQ